MEPTADEVIMAAQEFQRRYPKRCGAPIRALMDVVAGVNGYEMHGDNQGWLNKKLLRDRIEKNHVIDYDVMVSKFWQGVMNALPKVVAKGTTVVVVLNDGGSKTERATQMSPLNYLRNTGLGFARRYIDESFRNRLRQQCNDCGTIMKLSSGGVDDARVVGKDEGDKPKMYVGTTREYDNGCPKCHSDQSELIGGFLRKRKRRCIECGTVRAARFERVCGVPVGVGPDGKVIFEHGCGSENITLVTAEDNSLDDNPDGTEIVASNTDDPETQYVEAERDPEISVFIREIEASMPRDPGDPTGDSKNRKILRILTDPREGREVCQSCRASAKDPDDCCPAEYFTIDECINYSRKIGQFLGVTTTLANRRVAKVREHTRKFARTHQKRYKVAAHIMKRLAAV